MEKRLAVPVVLLLGITLLLAASTVYSIITATVSLLWLIIHAL